LIDSRLHHKNKTMKEALIVAIVFGSFVLIPAVIGGTIVLSIRLLKGGSSRKTQTEDSRIIQETYQGLARMEERVEALETILLDRKNKEPKA
jgi:phage shock protein B